MATATKAPTEVILPLVLRGGNLALYNAREPEVLAEGPAGTGKTRTALELINDLCHYYPGLQVLMCRKIQATMALSCIREYRMRVLHRGDGVAAFGGSGTEPEGFRYRNGSFIAVGGMDKPDKILSSFFDIIYCFLGETRVQSPSTIGAAFVREYSGPLVTIRTALGNELTGTPNHPVLTTEGWVPLGKVVEGSYVVSRTLAHVAAAGDPDVDDQTPTIAEVAHSLAQTGRLERMAGSELDFHGDGSAADVHVVTAYSQLQHSWDTASDKPVVQHQVRGSNVDASFLSGDSTSLQPFLLNGAATNSSVTTFSNTREPTGVTPHPHEGSLRLSASLNAATLERVVEGMDTDAKVRCEREGAHPVEVTTDRVVHFRLWDQAPGESRQVYNLQNDAHWYVANGIVVHNCNEGHELTLEDFETLTTRLRAPSPEHQPVGRNGEKFIHRRIIMDTNPTYASHWLMQRSEGGPTRLIKSKLQDNPVYYDSDGNPTEEGEAYIARLDRLTGIRYQRFRLGQRVGVENAIYEPFSRLLHVRPLEPGLHFESTIIGVDYGTDHLCAVVALSIDQYRRRWVRECWAESDTDEGVTLTRVIGQFKERYHTNRGRVDPNQGYLAGRTGFSTAKGGSGGMGGPPRLHRIDLMEPLFYQYEGGRVPSFSEEIRLVVPTGPFAEPDSPGFFIVEGSPGSEELCEEIEAYHYVWSETPRGKQKGVYRVDDDRIAAVEYANEEYVEGKAVDYSQIQLRGQSQMRPVRVV